MNELQPKYELGNQLLRRLKIQLGDTICQQLQYHLNNQLDAQLLGLSKDDEGIIIENELCWQLIDKLQRILLVADE